MGCYVSLLGQILRYCGVNLTQHFRNSSCFIWHICDIRWGTGILQKWIYKNYMKTLHVFTKINYSFRVRRLHKYTDWWILNCNIKINNNFYTWGYFSSFLVFLVFYKKLCPIEMPQTYKGNVRRDFANLKSSKLYHKYVH